MTVALDVGPVKDASNPDIGLGGLADLEGTLDPHRDLGIIS